MPRSIVEASSAASAAPPPFRTRFVADGPQGDPPGWVAWPVERAPSPASAAERRSWTTPSATPAGDQRDRLLRDALHVERARDRQRAAGRVVERDRRSRDARAEPARQRPAALGVRQAVVRERRRGTRAAARPPRARARPDRSPGPSSASGSGATFDADRRASVRRVDRGRRPPGVDGVAAAPVAIAADDLHERVAHPIVQPQPARRGDRGLDVARAPDAERLQPMVAGHGERVAQRGGAPARDPAGPSRRRSRRGRTAARAAAEPGCVPGPRARGGRRGGLRPPRRDAQRVVVEAVRRGDRGVPVAQAEDLHARVVDRRRLGRRRAREPRHQRSLADDRDLRVVARKRERALRDLERALRHVHATPTWTLRKRAGAAPWDTRIDCPGSPLPQLHRPTSRHSEAEQTASRLPQKRGVIPA